MQGFSFSLHNNKQDNAIAFSDPTATPLPGVPGLYSYPIYFYLRSTTFWLMTAALEAALRKTVSRAISSNSKLKADLQWWWHRWGMDPSLSAPLPDLGAKFRLCHVWGQFRLSSNRMMMITPRKVQFTLRIYVWIRWRTYLLTYKDDRHQWPT